MIVHLAAGSAEAEGESWWREKLFSCVLTRVARSLRVSPTAV